VEWQAREEGSKKGYHMHKMGGLLDPVGCVRPRSDNEAVQYTFFFKYGELLVVHVTAPK
jgi:hypothetical protein